jgi:ankyrin repeat protein
VKKLLLIFQAVFFCLVLHAQDYGYSYYEYGNQLLVFADEGNLDSVRYMVEQKNADINFPDYFGVTPLMFAAQQGYDSIVIYLIEQGANVNLASKDFSITA